ncbi:MAG: hypothetical protein JNM18_25400 [Planctomycetaceae bacterium]|nr:hypothetical protein [Planctomycetaceae bacterium]
MSEIVSSCNSAPGEVPVFTCHVIISGPDAAGRLHAVAAQFPDLKVEGANERDVLSQMTQQFKVRLAWNLARGEAIPWAEQPLQAAPGDRERWIPIHL